MTGWFVKGREWGGWRILAGPFDYLRYAFHSEMAVACRFASQEHIFENIDTGECYTSAEVVELVWGIVPENKELHRWQREGF